MCRLLFCGGYLHGVYSTPATVTLVAVTPLLWLLLRSMTVIRVAVTPRPVACYFFDGYSCWGSTPVGVILLWRLLLRRLHLRVVVTRTPILVTLAPVTPEAVTPVAVTPVAATLVVVTIWLLMWWLLMGQLLQRRLPRRPILLGWLFIGRLLLWRFAPAAECPASCSGFRKMKWRIYYAE